MIIDGYLQWSFRDRLGFPKAMFSKNTNKRREDNKEK